VRGLALFVAVLLAAATVSAATLVLQPGYEGKDSHLTTNRPSSNYGTYSLLTVAYVPTMANRGIVEFDLSPCTGATINSAYLELYNDNPNATYEYCGIYRVLAAWVEMSVTWNNQPAHRATAYTKTMIGGKGVWKFDVKTLVSEWAAGTYANYGFILKKDNETRGLYPMFCSSDHVNSTWRPKITVDYAEDFAVVPDSVGRVKALFR